MRMKMRKAMESLVANNFFVHFAENGEIACAVILDMIPKDAVVGIGDSATVRQIEILDKLEAARVKILNPFSRTLTTDPGKREIRYMLSRKIFTSDVLITGTNAVTVDGKLINIDAVGNRVSAMIFGPKQVIIIAGKNKIVKDVKEAFHRIRNVIAPHHARTKAFGTPCTQTGKCSNCNSKRRICNVTTIIEKEPWQTRITVILVDEDLGLSWNERWQNERIAKIKLNYERATWVFARPSD